MMTIQFWIRIRTWYLLTLWQIFNQYIRYISCSKAVLGVHRTMNGHWIAPFFTKLIKRHIWCALIKINLGKWTTYNIQGWSTQQVLLYLIVINLFLTVTVNLSVESCQWSGHWMLIKIRSDSVFWWFSCLYVRNASE